MVEKLLSVAFVCSFIALALSTIVLAIMLYEDVKTLRNEKKRRNVH